MEKDIMIIQGQEMKIINLNLSIDGYEATLTIKALVNKKNVCVVFHNVSNLTIDELSMPFQITGFQILDNKNKGWDKSIRYTVLDFEQDNIRFYCECYEIV